MNAPGYLLDSGNRSGIGLVGRSPWTPPGPGVPSGDDALVRLLAGRPGGRPRARAPAPHRATERGLPESSGYPTDLFITGGLGPGLPVRGRHQVRLVLFSLCNRRESGRAMDPVGCG